MTYIIQSVKSPVDGLSNIFYFRMILYCDLQGISYGFIHDGFLADPPVIYKQ